MAKYQMRINTDAYKLSRCSKKNWEPGTRNDYMLAINGIERTLCNLREVLWQLEMFGGNTFLSSEYDEKNAEENYGLSNRYLNFLKKNEIHYHDKLCNLDRWQYLSGYGFMQGTFSAGTALEVLKKKDYVKVPFADLYDIRQYSKAMDGCYMEIWKVQTGTIKQIYKEKGIEVTFDPIRDIMTDAVYNIGFTNSDEMEDETQFDIHGTRTIKETLNELTDLFKQLCKENGYKTNKVQHITYVGTITGEAD